MRIEKLDSGTKEITITLKEEEIKNIANAMYKCISKSNENEKKQFEDSYGKIMFTCDMMLNGFPSEQSMAMIKLNKSEKPEEKK